MHPETPDTVATTFRKIITLQCTITNPGALLLVAPRGISICLLPAAISLK